MSALKNVVIVGTSAAGGNAAKKLVKSLPSEYRVVIIEQLKFAYWPIGALRAAVQPGFETSVVAEIDPIVPAGSHHILIKGVQVVSLEENAVVLEKPTKDFPDAKVTFEVGPYHSRSDMKSYCPFFMYAARNFGSRLDVLIPVSTCLF
jgi:NADH dehydrogenase FAD-containing subunit